jgi:hypothetical protein
MHPVVLLGDEGQAKAHFDLFGDSLNPMQDRCTVCDHCTNGMEIALGAPDGVTYVKWKLVSVYLEIV